MTGEANEKRCYGNALSIPYAKGFGWGADLNLNNIFTKAFSSPKGQGYPASGKESQNRNAAILSTMKSQIAKPLVEALKSLDQNMVKEALIPRFLDCFYAGCKDDELKAYVDSVVASK